MTRAAEARPARPAQAIGVTAFRRAMASFPTGVTVVTVACGDGIMHGMTVNSFSSVSLDPLLVLVCLNRTGRAAGLIDRAGAFTVNVLSAGQHDLSRWFADRRRPPGPAMFEDVPFQTGLTGCPVLVGAAASFECALQQSHLAGDHLIVLGEVIALVHHPELEPLIFQARDVQVAAALPPPSRWRAAPHRQITLAESPGGDEFGGPGAVSTDDRAPRGAHRPEEAQC